VGNGDGMIVQRGYKPAGNFHDSKRMAQPLSHYFYVMTNGYGAMPDYSAQLPPVDRWAVAAYIRALQLSQDAKESDVPQGTPIQSLSDVAQQEGLPAGYAGPWSEPGTAVNALPTKGIVAGAPGENPNAVQLNQPPVNPQAVKSSKGATGGSGAAKPPASH
jgi:hypothetical protein